MIINTTNFQIYNQNEYIVSASKVHSISRNISQKSVSVLITGKDTIRGSSLNLVRASQHATFAALYCMIILEAFLDLAYEFLSSDNTSSSAKLSMLNPEN